MAILTKVFNGAQLNSNDSHEYMAPTDLVDGSGVRIQTEEGNSQGLVKTLEGNREITRSLPAGTNTILRAKTFPEVRKTYIFTKNSNGNHRIEEFDYVTESFTTLYENLTDSGNENLVDWSGVLYIKDVVLIQGTLLYWTEFPNDVVRRVDVAKARGNEYGVFRESDFYLYVLPPTRRIGAFYRSESFYNQNNVTGGVYQFRYRYVYDNDEKSVWSVMSARPIPEDMTGRPPSVYNNNIIIVNIPLDVDFRYTAVEISFREDNGSWHFIKSVSREYIEGLGLYFFPPPDPPPPLPPLPPTPYPEEGKYGVTEATNYLFVFKNDSLYTLEPDVETDQLYDEVPRRSRALESVNDNTILLGNNEIGFKRPEWDNEDYGADISLYELEVPDVENLFTVTSFEFILPPVSGQKKSGALSGSPEIGDTFSAEVIWGGSSTPTNREIVSITITSVEAGDLGAALTALVTEVNNETPVDLTVVSTSTVGNSLQFIVNWTTSPGGVVNMYTEVSGASLSTASYPSLKLMSSYQLAVGHFRKGQPYPIITGKPFIVNTPSMAELEFWETNMMLPQIDWVIPTEAPEGADSYVVLITTNRTHENTIYTNATIVEESSSREYITFDITPLFLLAEKNKSGNIGYEYTPGDRVTIVSNINSGGNQRRWVNNPPLVAEVTGLEIDTTDPDDIKYYLSALRPQGSLQNLNTANSVLLEIYTPKKTSESIYYEISDIYPVVNGEHTVTSGSIRAMDAYFKRRNQIFPLSDSPADRNRVVWVEDFNYSDQFPSKIHQGGRPRSYNDIPEQRRFKSEIRHSREWISGSRVNGIVRFYPEDVYDAREPMYGAQENYGGIQYLQNRENRLICVQELKVGYIPVNRSIIEDTLEQQQVGISSKLLNPITYYAGPNIGIGNDYAVPSFLYVNGSCYFVDPVEMLPVRAGLDGTRYIGYKYSGALKGKIRQHIRNGEYIKSLFDDRFNEWLLLFPDTTWVFDEKIDGWVPKKPYLPEAGFSADDVFYTFNAGGLYAHDDESNRNVFYGTAYPAEISFSVTSPGVKTFRSIEQHSDSLMVTEELGIETQLGQISELNLSDDYDWNGEGVYLSNLLFDNNSPGGIPNGDLLKGRWILFKLRREPGGIGEINLLKFVVKDTYSTPNIT